MKKISLIFFGTENFAATILQGLIDSPDFEIKTVITQPDKPVGREQTIQKPPVKILAEKYCLKVEQPITFKNFNLPTGAELGVAVQYGLLIPKQILESLPRGIINIHPSLLPKYRGASPIQSAIINGETETGLTIMKMDEGLDTGPILLQKTVKIEPNETYTTLAQKLAQIASKALTEVIHSYVSGQIQPQAQDNALATNCREFKREDGQIDWHCSAQKIYNQWRALQPWPGIFTEAMFGGKKIKIKILKMRPASSSDITLNEAKNIPFIKINKKILGAMAGDDQTLIIDEL
jgi:methionyl-tRNA formyltransferase